MTIRVLVVDDSSTARRRIASALQADPAFEIVGEAADGSRAIDLCDALRPDVMTLDLALPVAHGLAVVEHVMGWRPTPIVVVSGAGSRGELLRAFDALAAGALAALEKPNGGVEEEWDRSLRDTVRAAARIKVITHPRARLGRDDPEQPAEPRCRAIAIGASTGGPGALREVLAELPADLPVPILLVLHAAPAFATGLVQWLEIQSRIGVRCAIDREPLPARGVIVATPDHHLVLERGALRLDGGPARHHCRPSVDVLFESVASELGAEAAGAVLTGMGRDGAQGLLAMRSAGATTFAQDEATSVVYGMPREAAAIGAAEQVLPLQGIAPALLHVVRSRRRRAS